MVALARRGRAHRRLRALGRRETARCAKAPSSTSTAAAGRPAGASPPSLPRKPRFVSGIVSELPVRVEVATSDDEVRLAEWVEWYRRAPRDEVTRPMREACAAEDTEEQAQGSAGRRPNVATQPTHPTEPSGISMGRGAASLDASGTTTGTNPAPVSASVRHRRRQPDLRLRN